MMQPFVPHRHIARILPALAVVGLVATTGLFAACGAKADALALGDLKMDKPTTAKLKFWTQERGAVGDAIKPNLHFDDANNARVVLYGDAVEEVGKGLEKNAIYTVAFTPTSLEQKTLTVVTGTLGSVKK